MLKLRTVLPLIPCRTHCKAWVWHFDLIFFFNNTKTCVLFASALCCLMQRIILRIIKILKQLLQNMVFSFLTIRLQKSVSQRCGLSFEITLNLLHRYTEDISHPSLPQQPLYTYAMFELYNRICQLCLLHHFFFVSLCCFAAK